LIIGGKKITLKFGFPSEKVRGLRTLADVTDTKFPLQEIWRGFQDEIRTYFAQHPEETL